MSCLYLIKTFDQQRTPLDIFNFEYSEKGTTLKIISNDATDYDWNRGGNFYRKLFIGFERARTGLGDNHGFKTIYYGTNNATQNKK